jgi:hypothetical protein
MKELCDQINNISSSNLNSRLINNRITITKKYFSDFYPFNLGHLCSMTIHAKSKEIESESGNLEFVIEMNDLFQITTFGSIMLLLGFSLLTLSNMEFIGIVVLIFTIIAVLWSNIVHNWGITNFTKNWDKHIGTKV